LTYLHKQELMASNRVPPNFLPNHNITGSETVRLMDELD